MLLILSQALAIAQALTIALELALALAVFIIVKIGRTVSRDHIQYTSFYL
jgi:hypothetical protein